MKEVLEKSKSSFLNPYVVFVSGIIHELGGELDDAYISYKKALELMPSNIYLQKDVLRLAEKLGREEELNKLKSTYPIAWEGVKSEKVSKNSARLVIIYEEDWVEKKQEEKISLGAVAVAYPIYKYKWSEPGSLTVKGNDKVLGATFPICYMSALTLRALKEEQKWRVIRQAARVAAKGSAFAAGATMTAVSSNSSVQLAGLGIMAATAVYNNMSENADLRCWMTLPDNVQILESYMPAGEYKLTFNPENTMISLEKTVELKEGETIILWIVNVGKRLINQQLWPSVPAK